MRAIIDSILHRLRPEYDDPMPPPKNPATNMTNETRMLNIAAAEYKLLRAALADCVSLLKELKERDESRMSGKTLRWMRGEPAALTLENAEQLLKPRHSEHPLDYVRGD